MTTKYTQPVSNLLNIGHTGMTNSVGDWLDYPKRFGLDKTHIPQLIEMGSDEDLWNSDPDSSEICGRIHAWRALAQLEATESVGPLLKLMNPEDAEWERHEMFYVMKMIGVPALPELMKFIEDESNDEYARCIMIEVIAEIGCVESNNEQTAKQFLAEMLEKFETNTNSINTYLIQGLAKLRAKEYLHLIEKLLAEEKVNFDIIDVEEIRRKLGFEREKTSSPANTVMTNKYIPPVSGLLTIGRTGMTTLVRDWIDYPNEFGLNKTHVPQLIEMGCDEDLRKSDPDSKEAWGRVHAWRALAQLEATEAVGPLLKLLNKEDGGWERHEMFYVMFMIGVSALPELMEFIKDESNHEFARCRMIAATWEAGYHKSNDPERKAKKFLAAMLEKYETNTNNINALLIQGLAELKAKEYLPLIEKILAEKKVNFEFIDVAQIRSSINY